MADTLIDEKEVFNRARQIAAALERRAYVQQLCGHDEAALRRMLELLRVYDNEKSFLEAPATGLDAFRDATVHETGVHSPGTMLGPYRLLRLIGEGGMGTVWMAQQTEPVRRLVAVKLIKAGMDSEQVIARFEAERQALALMDHPNIAKVLDGGTTGEPSRVSDRGGAGATRGLTPLGSPGRPFFVMELVTGVPITRYCEEGHLTPRERLELFIPVCQAVQHAHQKGIIHRDIKPSNVLVAIYDGKPVPKVIDFGVAKAVGQALTDKTLETGLGHLVGTLEYMSPEQAEVDQLDVDTRSDIYSLGVLLYELLTGTPPFSRLELERAGLLQMLRIIREQEPIRPSVRMKAAGGRFHELDWIVMKALEKDRSRRYETASDVAVDIGRYLRDEPVLACPPSTGYRLRKFMRRHQQALAMVAVLALVLLAALGAVTGTIGWALRDRDARSAAIEQKAHLALIEAQRLLEDGKYNDALSATRRAEGLLSSVSSETLRSGLRTLRQDLTMVNRLEEVRLPQLVGGVERAHDQAGANAAYGAAFQGYGIDVDALEPTVAAERIRARAIRLELIVAIDHWARLRRSVGDANQASWRQLVAISRAADPDEWRNQVRTALEEGKTDALAALLTSPRLATLPVQSLSLLGEILEPNASAALLRVAQRRYPDDFWINFQLAWSLERTQPPRVEDAFRYYTVAAALRPRNAAVRVFLGNAFLHRNLLDEAIAEYRTAIELQPDYVAAHHNLGSALRRKGSLGEAETALREAVRLVPAFSLAHLELAGIHTQREEWDEAIVHSTKALALKQLEALGRRCRGEAYLRTGQWGPAADDFAFELTGPITDAWTKVACLHLLAGHARGYQDLCRQLATLLEARGRSSSDYIGARVWGLSPNSPIPVEQTLEWAARDVAAGRNAWNLHALALAHYRAGEFEQAVQRSEESLQVRPDWQGKILNWLVLGMAQQRMNRAEEAARWLDKASAWRDQFIKGNERPVFPASLPVQDWLEFEVLFHETNRSAGTARVTD